MGGLLTLADLESEPGAYTYTSSVPLPSPPISHLSVFLLYPLPVPPVRFPPSLPPLPSSVPFPFPSPPFALVQLGCLRVARPSMHFDHFDSR